MLFVYSWTKSADGLHSSELIALTVLLVCSTAQIAPRILAQIPTGVCVGGV